MSESPHSDTDYRHDPHHEHGNPPEVDPAVHGTGEDADSTESGTTPEPSPAEEAGQQGDPDPRGERPVQPSVEPPG